MNQNQIIMAGFQNWADGTGSFFDLLSEDVHWTISGCSPLSKTYLSKKALRAWFMRMSDGKIIRVTAFLDTLGFADIFERIK